MLSCEIMQAHFYGKSYFWLSQILVCLVLWLWPGKRCLDLSSKALYLEVGKVEAIATRSKDATSSILGKVSDLLVDLLRDLLERAHVRAQGPRDDAK